MSCWPRFNLTASGRTNAKCDEWAGALLFAVHFAGAPWLPRGGCHYYFLPSPSNEDGGGKLVGGARGEDRLEEGKRDQANKAQDPVLFQHEEDRRGQLKELPVVLILCVMNERKVPYEEQFLCT